MKVNITAKSKKALTMEEAPIAKQIVKDMKEDESTVTDYAKMAVSFVTNRIDHANNSCEAIYEAKAEIAKNRHIWNLYNEQSHDIDIWITIVAKTWDRYYEIGCYLSDIWQIGPEENDADIESRMYIRRFAETK